MTGKAILAVLAAVVFLTGCETAALSNDNRGPFAPVGRYNSEDSIDGLIVGHRLMKAGEYDLALSAYYRAAGVHGLNVDTLSAIGSANLMLGRLGLAESSLRRAVKDGPGFPPAWNNLGVVLIETGQTAEAELVFRRAFALDSGESDSIRDNLRLAIAKNVNSDYVEDNSNFELVRRGYGRYLLLSKN